ncbi:hypothetical protein [Algirhabdus cladophorae]|uniref:hypothetical protein n=1 Tax=Algirhabdus cladophorae TaxID=3377108 RepID=UPI003B8450FF
MSQVVTSGDCIAIARALLASDRPEWDALLAKILAFEAMQGAQVMPSLMSVANTYPQSPEMFWSVPRFNEALICVLKAVCDTPKKVPRS